MKIKYSDNRTVFNINEETSRGIPYVSFRMLDDLGVPHLYTSRYQNCDLKTGTGEQGLRTMAMKHENKEEVWPNAVRNLSILAEQIGTDAEHLVLTRQLHTAIVKSVDADDLGVDKERFADDAVDGLVTNVPGACLVAYGADCPSVYLVDPCHHAIGLVHAGWKGTFGRIPDVAIKMMEEKYGSRPQDMYAAIGPSICESCYEMGDEIYDRLASEWSRADADALMKRHENGKYHLDLWKANRMTLERAGIPAEHIAVTNICTCCNADTFYSYRAGRMENEQVAMLVNRIG